MAHAKPGLERPFPDRFADHRHYLASDTPGCKSRKQPETPSDDIFHADYPSRKYALLPVSSKLIPAFLQRKSHTASDKNNFLQIALSILVAAAFGK